MIQMITNFLPVAAETINMEQVEFRNVTTVVWRNLKLFGSLSQKLMNLVWLQFRSHFPVRQL